MTVAKSIQLAFHQFMHLPQELRDHVYSHIIKDGIYFEPRLIHPQSEPLFALHLKPKRKKALENGYNIAFACRTISTEFLRHTYLYAVFKFPIVEFNTVNFRSWNVSSHVLTKIQNIRFVRDMNWEVPHLAYGGYREVVLEFLRTHCPSWKRVEAETILTPSMTEERATNIKPATEKIHEDVLNLEEKDLVGISLIYAGRKSGVVAVTAQELSITPADIEIALRSNVFCIPPEEWNDAYLM